MRKVVNALAVIVVVVIFIVGLAVITNQLDELIKVNTPQEIIEEVGETEPTGDYKIVSFSDKDTLETAIRVYIQHGWMPSGGIVYSQSYSGRRELTQVVYKL